MRLFLVVGLPYFCCIAGCATVASGTSQDIAIDTPKVAGATCELADSKSHKWTLPTSPGMLAVSRGDGPMTITCKKEGYRTTSITVEESLSGATLGNVLIGGGIGIFIDAMSGAAQRYPDRIVVWMEKDPWPSQAEHDEWLKEKAAFEASLEKDKKAIQEASKPPLKTL